MAVTTQIVRATQGHVGYALDDAYIHMAIARNLAQHGSWGITAGQFASASSSPLWTALLGVAFSIAGVHDLVPLMLNVVAAVALIAAAARVLRTERFTSLEQFAALGALVLLTPMVPMVWIGMEHSLNNLVVLLLVWAAVDQARPRPRFHPAAFLALASLAPAIRLEGLFVVAGCAAVLVVARRWTIAVVSSVLAAATLVGIGMWNVSHGWFFLPASVMMKQTVLPSASGSLGGTLLWSILHSYPPVVFIGLFVVGAGLLAHSWHTQRTLNAAPWLTVFVVASLLHLTLARFGFLYRYESYLMVIGTVGVALAVHQNAAAIARGLRIVAAADVVAVVAATGVIAGGERTLHSNAVLINTAGHIYRQQRQMGRFVSAYYNGQAVALNDIGAVSYSASARVYDLAGLGSLEAATARRDDTFDAAFINGWLVGGHVPLAIVYDFWYPKERRFYDRWVRVGRWITDNQDELTEGAVTFYAPDATAAGRLRANLVKFEPLLPPGVVVELSERQAALQDQAHVR
ncbi:MAG: hypothetical protein QM736_06890 [Vicinamibacterales bacterium]